MWAGFSAPIAAAALAMGVYLGAGESDGTNTRLVATGVILLAGIMHGLHLGAGVRGQNLAVVVKLVLLSAFLVFGFTVLADVARAEVVAAPVSVSFSVFAVQLMYVSFSYSGWNAAVYIAGEVRDPERNLSRALLLGAVGVTVLYLLLNTVFVFAAPVAELARQEQVGALAARALGGEDLEAAVRLLVALALFTSVSSMVMIGPRVYAKMAADGVFPAIFARGAEVPRGAVWLQCCLSIGLVWIAGLKDYLGYVGFTLGVSTAFAVVGLMMLRRRLGAAAVPIPGYPFTPLAFVLATFGIAGLSLGTGAGEFLAGLWTLLAGVVVYVLLTRRRSSA
jgi:APA family basic amino acid/polyamine antiporter